MSANETQVGGEHYKGAFQHWDFASQLGLGYFLGQVTKYVSRWRQKNGRQDLEKARHFLVKFIEEEQTRAYVFQALQKELVSTYALGEDEHSVIANLVHYHHGSIFHLQDALEALTSMIDREARREERAQQEAQVEIDELFSTKENFGGLV